MPRSVEPFLPQVSCYHAEIHVQDGDHIKTLLIDLPDWSPEEEIVQDLAMKYKAETMKDIVLALEGEGKVRVEGVGPNSFYCRGDRSVFQAEQRLI